MSMKLFPVPLLAAACIAAVLVAGCAGPATRPAATPAPTPSPTHAPESYSFDQTNNGGTYPVTPAAGIQLRLPENPTTGFSWNLSVTPGLSIVNDTYVPSDTSGKLVGSGGIHVWFLKVTGPGDQGISGVYRRPWEPAAANASVYSLSLIVGESPCDTNVCTIPTVPSTMPPRYHVYTEADSSGIVHELPGDTFGIRLQENPSTGYSWNLSLPAGLTLTRDEFIPAVTGSRVVGAGGTRSFTLVAAESGDWNITAEYRRPWVPAGTITRVDLEGGFFGIVADDGKRYEPANLDAKYQRDGLRVAFEATPAGDTMSARMWGTPVNLTLEEEIPGFSLGVVVS